MNDTKPNAVKVTLDDGRSFIVEGTNVPIAIAKLRRRGKLSEPGKEVAFVAKIWCDFDSEVVK